MDANPNKSKTYLLAEQMLPLELHPVLEQLVVEYRFASFKHHGVKFCSPRVIAELILMGWRSPPLSGSDTQKNDED